MEERGKREGGEKGERSGMEIVIGEERDRRESDNRKRTERSWREEGKRRYRRGRREGEE